MTDALTEAPRGASTSGPRPTPFRQAWAVAQSGLSRAAVIGAGSMGAGIAAQFANAGVPVDLLDIPADKGRRDARAEAGIAAQLRSGGFMGEGPVALVNTGNVEDHLDRLAQADWIIEAVIEDIAIKRDLYARIEAVRKPGALVSSNTSTLPRAALVEGFGAGFAAHFAITHFFNPPRHMELLELVAEPGSPAAGLAAAGRHVLGKTVIDCRDTPGFIANRIGCTWMSVSVIEALRLGLGAEEADAVQTTFGVPRTGVFGLLDLIGIDVIPHIWGSLMRALPDEDTINRFDLPGSAAVRGMIAAGRFGRKSRAGFYRRGAAGTREVIDFQTGDYRPQEASIRLPGEGRDLAALLADGSAFGAYARAVLGSILDYAVEHTPSIARGPDDVDAAMALGYGWRRGPFRILADLPEAVVRRAFLPGDAAGSARLAAAWPEARAARLLGGARAGAPKDRLARARAADDRLLGNDAARLWALGDRIACFEISTKANVLDEDVLDTLEAALAVAGRAYDALVIGNGNPRSFAAGADRGALAALIEAGAWDVLEARLLRGQRLFGALRGLDQPVIAAISGTALGGGCELALHCHGAAAHAEAALGLTQAAAGLMPGWGGTVRLLASALARDPAQGTARAFELLLRSRPLGSAREALAAGLLPEATEIVMHRGDVLEAAVAMAAAGAAARPARRTLAIAPGGAAAREALIAPFAAQLGAAERAAAREIAWVLTGGEAAGEVTEEALLGLERAAFMRLARRPEASARIRPARAG